MNIDIVVSNIENKIRKLVIKNAELQNNNAVLKTHNTDLQRIIENQTYKIKELEKKINVLNISGAITSGKEAAESKKIITALMREIDKCITLLDR